MNSTAAAAEALPDHDLVTRHDEQIKSLQATAKETSDQLKWMLRLMITTLIAAVGGLLVQLFKH
jgi:hypothetical protein